MNPPDLSISDGGEVSVATKGPELCTIAQVADALAENPVKSYDVVHQFTHSPDGAVNLYTRGCLLDPGVIYISKKHRTEHPWVMLKGACWVWQDDTQDWKHFSGAHSGITKPGTQRILWIEEPTVWMTFHATTESDVNKIEEAIIEPNEIRALIESNEIPTMEALLAS